MFLYLILEKTFWRFSHEILSMFGISIYNRYDAKNRITNWLNVSFSFLSFFFLVFLVHFRISFGIGLKNCSLLVKFTMELHNFSTKYSWPIFSTRFLWYEIYIASYRNIILEFLWFQNGWRWRLISLILKILSDWNL